MTANKDRFWDFGVIPYVTDDKGGCTHSQKAGFRAAMDDWGGVTWVKLLERNASEHRSFYSFYSFQMWMLCIRWKTEIFRLRYIEV